MSDVSPLEALARELAGVAARIEREAKAQLEAATARIEAKVETWVDLKMTAVLAEMREEMAALRAARAEGQLWATTVERNLVDAVEARLATVRDGEPGPPGESVAGPQGEPGVGEPGPPGPPPDEALVARLIEEAVARYPAEPGPPGPPPDNAVVRSLITEVISGFSFPVGSPGPPGPPPDEAVVERLIDAAVSRRPIDVGPQGPPGPPPDKIVLLGLIREEVARLPVPVAGPPGPPVEESLVHRLVEEEVAKLPPPERGEPGPAGPPGETIVGPVGPPVDEALVHRLIEEEVAKLPLPERGEPGPAGPPGQTVVGPVGPPVDEALVARLIADEMTKLPPAEKGDPGPAGESIVGPAGPQGPPGKLHAVKLWQDGVHYQGDVVVHDGATYQAQIDTGRQPPHDDWLCLAQAGRDGKDGADGQTFNIRGTWKASTAYHSLDVVMLEGASFVARTDNPGHCPGDGWQLLAKQGRRGEVGERGASIKGDRGDPGRIIAVDLDNEGLLVLTNEDGTSVNCDFYPLFARASGR